MHSHIKFVLVGLLICLITACAKPYYLNVGYHLPEEPRQLAGQNVSLVIQDQREDKTLFSETAVKEFRYGMGPMRWHWVEPPRQNLFRFLISPACFTKQ